MIIIKKILLSSLIVILLSGCVANEEKIIDLEVEIDSLDEENSVLENEIDSLEVENSILEDEIDSLEEENNILEGEIVSLEEEKAMIEEEFATLVSESEDEEIVADIKVDENIDYNLILLGVYHDSPMVGSGYGDKYQFFEDKTYILDISDYDTEGRLRKQYGTWYVIDDLLYLEISKEEILEGGEFIEDFMVYTGYTLVNAELSSIDLETPKTLIYPISDFVESFDEPSSLGIGGIVYWRISQYPDTYLD